jgi:two-component system, NarL family, invasion response regulator UvrY
LNADPVSVLIVDDQAPFRAAARSVVAVTAGFEVVGEVDSGEAAITEARAVSPGLILMDINLPGINGIGATREILSEAPGTVVILLSSYQAGDLPADAATCGAAAYVHKEDFSPDEVRRIWAAQVGA